MEASGEDLEAVLRELAGKQYVTIGQAAKITGRTYRTVRSWIHPPKNNPELPPILRATQVGGEYRIYVDEMVRFLREGKSRQ